jgi:L-lysine exporter family protein LysE/ArgO
MMIRSFFIGFFLSLSLCCDIGIVNTAIINTAIRKGFRPSFLIGFGSCFGDLLYAIISLTSLVMLLTIPGVRTTIWITGNILLIYLIVKMILQIFKDPQFTPSAKILSNDQFKFFSTGFLLSLASPTTILWFASIGSSLIASQRTGSTSLTLFAFLPGFFTAGLLWSFSLAVLVSSTRNFFSNHGIRWLNIISVVGLILLSTYSIIDGIKLINYSCSPIK